MLNNIYNKNNRDLPANINNLNKNKTNVSLF